MKCYIESSQVPGLWCLLFLLLSYCIIILYASTCVNRFLGLFYFVRDCRPGPTQEGIIEYTGSLSLFPHRIYNMKALEDQEQIEYPQDNAKADPHNTQDTPCFGLAGLAGPHAHAGP